MTPANLVREGHVVAHDGVVAELALTTPCHSCQSRCLLGSFAERRVRVATPRESALTVGAPVDIAVSRSALTRSCALVFGVPLLAWLCGGVLGSQMWGETAGVCLALLMFTAALVGLGANQRSLRRWTKLELIALGVVSNAERTAGRVF